jgi:hypothetical protein
MHPPPNALEKVAAGADFWGGSGVCDFLRMSTYGSVRFFVFICVTPKSLSASVRVRPRSMLQV